MDVANHTPNVPYPIADIFSFLLEACRLSSFMDRNEQFPDKQQEQADEDDSTDYSEHDGKDVNGRSPGSAFWTNTQAPR